MSELITTGLGLWMIATLAAYFWPSHAEAGPAVSSLATVSGASMAAVLAGAGWFLFAAVI